MKNFIFSMVLTCTLFPYLASAEQKKKGCTREQAFEKHSLLTMGSFATSGEPPVKFDEEGNFIRPDSSEPQDEEQRLASVDDLKLSMEMASIAPILAQGDYNRACKEYDRIAESYGLDYKEIKKHLEVEKHKLGAQVVKPEKCTPEQAGDRVSKLSARFRNTTDERLLGVQKKFQAFYLENANALMINPGVFCTKLAAFVRENGL